MRRPATPLLRAGAAAPGAVGALTVRGCLFGLAFLVVYREAFETILFYAAMWEDSPGALLAGVCVGAALLGAIAWAMLLPRLVK